MRSRRRVIAVIVLLALVFVTLAHPSAPAEYQGSSLYDNVAPESQAQGSLADRYPLNRYGLDYHVTAGVTDTSIGPVSVPSGVDIDGIPALIMHGFAALVWDLTKFLLNAVITLFTFAFSLDLVAGSSQTGGQGALAPVAQATRDLYDALGEWLAVAIAVVGGWMAWQIFVKRQMVATFGQLGVSVVMVLVAMLLITQPQWTVGGASKLSNELSLAVLGALNEGDTRSAKTQASNQLFESLIYDPWVVLNFGGTEHCVDGHNRPVKPKSPACKTLIDNRRKYAERWLRAGTPNGKARTAEYEAIKDGKTPVGQTSYQLSDADQPAVDIQQQAMGGERLGYAVLIFLGSLGAVVLLGALSIGVILTQVVALLLFAFSPLIVLVAVFPGVGHAAFRTWFERLGSALTRKVWYGLILAVLLAISSALLDASASLGWLMAFGLQSAFYWAVFLYRKEIYAALWRALPGSTGAGAERHDLSSRARDMYYTGKLLTPAAQAVGSTAQMGLRLGGATAAGTGRVGRAGLRSAGELADQYASQGHAARVTAAAATTAAAVSELEQEHRSNRGALRKEHGRRARIRQLEGYDDALSSEQRQELEDLRQDGMDSEAFRQLETQVGEVEQRRSDGEALFTEEQVRTKAQEIAEREAAASDTTDGDSTAAPHADYERSNDVRGGGRDAEYEARTEETARTRDRLRKYASDEFDQIFPNGAAPLTSERARGLFGARRRRRKNGEGDR